MELGQLLPVPLPPESCVSGFRVPAIQMLGDLGKSLAPLWASVSLCVQKGSSVLPSVHALLGGFDGRLRGTWELLGRRDLGDSQWDGKTQPGTPGVGPLTSVSPLRGVSSSLYPAGEVVEAQSEDAVSNPGRRDLCPQGHHQPVGCPLSPHPSPGPLSGLSSGAGKLLTSSPHPGLGGWPGTGNGQLKLAPT